VVVVYEQGDEMKFELVDSYSQKAVIKVIGVGGGGGNAVNHMVTSHIEGVDFICANTDAQALKGIQARSVIQLGNTLTKGLGAGANPDIGRQAALDDRERILEVLDGADMVFITAGMGGGTGTGAAPVIAEIAKEAGVLTVAVVTKPFPFEGKKRRAVAEKGIDELSQFVDSLITIPNEKLLPVLGKDVSLVSAFAAANDVLLGAVQGIADLITRPGLINVDFADVRTVMSEMGMAMMGSSSASGIDRARVAAEQAVACPLLEDINIHDARGVLVNISAAKSTLRMKEMHEVMNTIRAFTADSATVIVGAVFDEDLADSLRVTIVATGLGTAVNRQQPKPLSVVKTGTDNAPVMEPGDIDYSVLDQTPAIVRRNRATVEALKHSGVEELDIPAFLRKQAD
jgi:cell division protein FtsZ